MWRDKWANGQYKLFSSQETDHANTLISESQPQESQKTFMLFKSPIWIACYDNPTCAIEDFTINISPGNIVKEFDELRWITVDIESN